MLPQWIIEKKRDGGALDAEEIRFFIEGFAQGRIPDYQMAALAMAVYFRGMTPEETAILTEAMIRTGRRMDTSSLPLPAVDKHSTGGIGDKVSLILAPLAACCGVAVPMISGRGLGITGGTLDKMEAIPGYRTDLTTAQFLDVLRACGCSIIGQTDELAPVDKRLYALRDVTGTVPSIPLISASIMSKKLAEGIGALVLDVKWGSGAFMKTPESARELARSMAAIGRRMGTPVTAVLTEMNEPLGRAVGNSVEVVEAVEALQGRGPSDLMEVTLALGAHMLLLARVVPDRSAAEALLNRQIANGNAVAKFKEMVRLHGGNAAVVEDISLLPQAAIRAEYPAPEEGYLREANAERIGRACVVLGAGRLRVEDRVDPAVGITGLAKTGEYFKKGQPLLTLHANERPRLDEAIRLLDGAFAFSPTPEAPRSRIAETIQGDVCPANRGGTTESLCLKGTMGHETSQEAQR